MQGFTMVKQWNDDSMLLVKYWKHYFTEMYWTMHSEHVLDCIFYDAKFL